MTFLRMRKIGTIVKFEQNIVSYFDSYCKVIELEMDKKIMRKRGFLQILMLFLMLEQ